MKKCDAIKAVRYVMFEEIKELETKKVLVKLHTNYRTKYRIANRAPIVQPYIGRYGQGYTVIKYNRANSRFAYMTYFVFF